MASIHASSDTEANTDVPLELVIFSCGTCQATIPEVYATTESNKGFHSGSGDDESIVTKMWIAECSHVFCGKHLPGGAAPFHADGQQPQAACPQCSERGDYGPRALYGIRGLQPGQLDLQIPADWIQCPAIAFDGTVPGMEAVRFQYMSIARYAQRVTYQWKKAQDQQRAIQSAYSHEQEEREQVQRELDTMKARLAGLEAMEAKLQKWEARKPMINHYLNAVHDMANDMADLRLQLRRLGYPVPEKSYAFTGNTLNSGPQVPQATERTADPQAIEFNSSSTTAVAVLDHSSSSHKRKPVQSAFERRTKPTPFDRNARADSRDMMPPPVLGRAMAQSRQASNISALHQRDRTQVNMPSRPTATYGNNLTRAHDAHDFQEGPGSLPFRPSQHVGPSHESRADARLSPDWSGQRQLWPSTSRDPDTRPLFATQSGQNDPTPNYEAHYGTLPQQQHFQERPLAPPPASAYHNPAWMNTDHHHHDHMRTTPSPQRHAMHPAPYKSVTSSFFKPNALGQTSTRQVPVSGRNVPSSRASFRDQPGDSHNAAGYNAPSPFNRQPHQPALNTVGNQLHAASTQPYHNQTQLRAASRSSAWGGQAAPQTPRNSQGLFQRPDRMHSPKPTYASSRPQSTAHRGRVSFPPGQQQSAPTRLHQEHALSQIRGVRGASLQGFRPGQYSRGPLYDPPPPPFSSAGGRRSVRR